MSYGILASLVLTLRCYMVWENKNPCFREGLLSQMDEI